MTLQQKMAELLSQWRGMDATSGKDQRDQLIENLIALMKQELAGKATKVSETAKPGRRLSA